MRDKLNNWVDQISSRSYGGLLSDGDRKWFAIPVVGVLLILLLLGIYWSKEPALFDVVEAATARAPVNESRLTTGSYTTSSVIAAMETLLDKRGGYLSNDIMPPSIWLDNIPNWEFGVLVQVRDISRSMRNDFSRSQSQSTEDADLIIAEPNFNFDHRSWFLPASENIYREGIDALYGYLNRLQNPNNPDAQFYARADNLKEWLGQVTKRLGSLSKTPWSEIDDVFYETRGAAWALIHFMKAMEIDFESVLQKKNALISLRQIIRELEATQDPLWSPMIMNGSGFGIFANHSLVMGSYISRANAAVIDLRNLLEQG